MKSNRTLLGDVVRDYLEKYPDKPSMTIARLIYFENPVLYKSIEQVRHRVRYYRGQSGEYHRENCTDKRFFRPAGSTRDFLPPVSEEVEYNDFVIHHKSIGIISDIHVPYHSVQAVKSAIDWLAERGIDSLLINGDLVDVYHASRFVRDPRKRSIAYEIEATNELLDAIQDYMPKVKLYYKIGNHEERLEIYLYTKAQELLGFDQFRMSELLHAKERNMDVIEDQRKITAGKLTILHGHELGIGSNSVNPARSTFLKTKQSCLVGHSHVTSEHTETRLDGDIITTWSVGCLSELHPRYARINKWNHGFAHVKIGDDGDYRVKNLRIYNGKVL